MHRLVLLAAFVASSGFFAHAQSLGEIAKKAAEQREEKKDSEPTKVYTNKDLKEEPPSPITPASSTMTSSAPSTSASPTAAPAVPPPADYRQVSMKDEAYWKGRMQAAQSALDTDSIHHAAMVARVHSLSADFNDSRSISQRGVLRQEREQAETEVTRLKAAVEADHKAIVTIEEEARRIGVPAGWLRP